MRVEQIRNRHYANEVEHWGGDESEPQRIETCATCVTSSWPCDTAYLLDRLTQLEAAVRDGLKEIHAAYFAVLPFLSSYNGQGANIAIECSSKLESAIRKTQHALAEPQKEDA